MINRTAVIADERYMLHDPGPGHPESPLRIRTILNMFDEPDAPKVVRLTPITATPELIELNHARSYIEKVALTAEHDSYIFDADTSTRASSYGTALLAVGGLCTLVDAVLNEEFQNGFAFVRPPGHHAEYDRAMGFCLFNNIAIAARYLIQHKNLERVLIVDWDLHHGNGTQHSFYDNPQVLYFSIHQYPYYPGTGHAQETGVGRGEGYNVNVPLPAGCDDAIYLQAFQHILQPIAKSYNPDFILVSAGFDAHSKDPLGGMKVTENGFTEMTRMVVELADHCCDGRLALVLEGGYHLESLAKSVRGVLEVLVNPPLERYDIQLTTDILEPVRKIQSRYWNL